MSFLSKLFGTGSKPANDARVRLQEAEALGLRFKEVEVQPNGHRYEVLAASSRKKAIDCLRRIPVTEARLYLVVETPEGNVGKDMIMIFDEKTQEMIEFGERQPLPEISNSRNRCARCGYPVLPTGRLESGVEWLFSLEEMREDGSGLRCRRCNVLWCASCALEAKFPTSRENGQIFCILCGQEAMIYEG